MEAAAAATVLKCLISPDFTVNTAIHSIMLHALSCGHMIQEVDGQLMRQLDSPGVRAKLFLLGGGGLNRGGGIQSCQLSLILCESHYFHCNLSLLLIISSPTGCVILIFRHY